MNSKTILMLTTLMLVGIVFLFEILSITNSSRKQTHRNQVKKQAVEITQLPDLALTCEATWLRHRSLSSTFYIFPDDGALLDYFPSSFTFNMTNIVKSSLVEKP